MAVVSICVTYVYAFLDERSEVEFEWVSCCKQTMPCHVYSSSLRTLSVLPLIKLTLPKTPLFPLHSPPTPPTAPKIDPQPDLTSSHSDSVP